MATARLEHAVDSKSGMFEGESTEHRVTHEVSQSVEQLALQRLFRSGDRFLRNATGSCDKGRLEQRS